MRAQEFITEAASTNLLIIDVQPEYDDWCSNILPGVQSMITKSTGKVVIVYNDFGGGDSADDVYNYLAGHDSEFDGYTYDEETDEYIPAETTPLEQKLQRAEYVQKEYGFLRPFMDWGVSAHTIIYILRLMYQQKVSDSRNIPFESLPEEIQAEFNELGYGWEDEGIYTQEWVPVARLKQLSPFYMMGGGRNECLREIELICNAFNIRFKRVDSLVY